MEELLRQVALWSRHEMDQLAGGAPVEKALTATQPAALAYPGRQHTAGASSETGTGTSLRNFPVRTGDESWMREICMSSLKRGRAMAGKYGMQSLGTYGETQTHAILTPTLAPVPSLLYP